MTYHSASPALDDPSLDYSTVLTRRRGGKPLASKQGKDALSDVVVKALWKSYPQHCTSEAQLAEEARRDFLNDDGTFVSPRTIKYWLRGTTLPSALHLSTLVQMQPKLFLAFWFGRIWR